MGSENIYVFGNTCNNIFVVNPNKVTTEYNNNGENRNIKQENLIYYANLDCELIPRSRLINGSDKNTVKVVSLASMNFLNPTGDGSLTTDWTSIQDTKVNQNQIATQLLGMKGISYKVGLSYIPTVTISLEDVKGRALFESGDNSPYSAFFNLPYPTFYLTLKGYYGKAVRYPLILQKFTSSFNSSSGNFDISLTMIGYKFNVLTDITMAELFAVPQMYIKKKPTSGVQNGGSQTQTKTDSITQRGYEEIKKVYTDYKSLGLIDKNFPELTVQQLSTKLDNFITYSLSSFGQSNLKPLSNIDTYAALLKKYRDRVYTSVAPKSWFNLNVDQDKFFVTKLKNNVRYKIYTYKLSNFSGGDTISTEKITNQYGELKGIITDFNLNLGKNETFGSGEYKIENPISVNSVDIDYNSALSEIDFKETYNQRNNVQTATDDNGKTINAELINLNGLFGNIIDGDNKKIGFLFQFDGDGRFLNQTYSLNKTLEDKKNIIEEKLTKELSNFVQTASGLGFAPTLRNIVAVIMASAEAFLRLMDDVHRRAMQARNSEIKKLVTESHDAVSKTSPVFPWPQFLVEKSIDGQKKLEIQYPGDDSVISVTHGNNYDIWPEVEFVEEFLRGYLQREVPPFPPPVTNEGVNRILVSAFDTIPTNQPYQNLEVGGFLYEIWERIQTICSYNGFQKNNDTKTNQLVLNFISEIESINAFNSLNSGNKENSPALNFMFETEDLTQQSFYSKLVELLKKFTEYSYGYFVTDYLDKKINKNPNQILSSDLPVIQITSEKEEDGFKKYIESAIHDDISFTDTYPFIHQDWNRDNLAQGQDKSLFKDINKTDKSIYYNNLIKKVTNYKDASVFENNGNKKTIRPFTDYNCLKNEMSLPVDLETFYKTRKLTDFVVTEGYLNYLDSKFTNKQTTSILNTPYFINAMQKGINGYLNGEVSPYKEAAYLFLNSLPLSTIKERYLSFENNANAPSDFIFAGLRKFGAIHRLPLFWLLKIGSVWNRYKTYVNNDQDILSGIWANFNYLENFDPINSSPSTTYILSSTTLGGTVSITLESSQSTPTYNIGFYPKLINEFYKFYNIDYLYNPTTVTNTLEIQKFLQDALDTNEIILFNTDKSNINSSNSNLKTWTVLIKSSNKNSYVVCPSFGTITNQINKECFDPSNNNIIPLAGNNSIHNGAVRLFWGASNYGYFDTTKIKKPSYNQYLKKVFSNVPEQTSFEIFSSEDYSNIEELFTVFDYDELEVFESKFLEFSKSGGKNEYNDFETIFKSLMESNETFENIVGQNYNNIVETIGENQSINITNIISSALNFDTLYKRSNPTGFDKNLFNLLSLNPSPEIKSRYNIQTYDTTPNSVPTPNVTSYVESYISYPAQWKAMELYVGFSTINGLVYDAPKNYLTNFFKIFNIGFTVDNIKTFRNLIKIYGSTAINGVSSKIEFQKSLNDYLTKSSNLSGDTFTNFITRLKKKMGVTKENPQKIDSAIDGLQSKVELYDMFKAINDKWISANDYTKPDDDYPLFKDYLFLDRGNRNVGDIFVDISKVNSYLKGAYIKSNVFTVIGSIIKDHNFVSFLMPAYVNFYGRQTPTNPTTDFQQNSTPPIEFANNLFGTFDTVDYQSSSPKMLNIYVDKPSQQVDNKNKANGYKDDGLDITICADNTIDLSSNKKINYSLENKVVGFAVDFELQNQGVFKKINVSQDLGKATSESLLNEYNTANSVSGVKTSTQNVSLYNIYKSRSYSSSVECMGNAMLQPSMYFVLRNIPLFAGSYFITEVSHSVTTEDFTTSITGTRQAAPTLPKVDNLFQTIKRELLTNLGNIYKNQSLSNTGLPTNVDAIKNSITNSLIGGKTIDNAISCEKNEAYVGYVKYSAETISDESNQIIITYIKKKLTIEDKIKLCLFVIIWIESGDENKINFYGNNPAGVTLTYDYQGDLRKYFLLSQDANYYMCLTNSKGYTQSYAVFYSLENHFDFLIAAYTDYINQVVTDILNPVNFANQFAQFWISNFPYPKTANTSTIYTDYITTNNTVYQELLVKIKKAFEIYNKVIPTN